MKPVNRLALMATIVVIVAGILYYTGILTGSSPVPTRTTTSVATYASPDYGVSFSYPSRYFVAQRDMGTLERGHYNVSLFQDTSFNRDLVAGKVQGTEGPISLSVDIYQNNLDNLTPEQWMVERSESNYTLGRGTFVRESVGGVPGVAYTWSGLYNGRTVVVAKGEYLYSFTATYDSLTDITLADFPMLLQSVEFH